jgi:LDH2 family malate/lactate/ureidoglycolate dehydrogenase
MTQDTTGFTRISEDALLALATRGLMGFGVSHADAEETCRVLVAADLFGIHTHGVSRVASYGERLALGGINRAPDIRIDNVAPVLLTVDGDNGLGPLIGARTLTAAMKAAGAFGMAGAFVRGSNHFGPIAPYALQAAEAGFATIIGSNATTTIAPTGGGAARLGNNPMAFGIPNPDGPPIILDMALSVVARAKVRNARDRGEPIPATWATDRQGRPTTDAKAALDGFLLPIGGYKGYGLAVMIDLFAGLLSGAAFLTKVKSWVDDPDEPQNLGHFFILIDTKRLMPAATLAERMAQFGDILHDTPLADPAVPIRLPGEMELASHARAKREGLLMSNAVLAELETFSHRKGDVS